MKTTIVGQGYVGLPIAMRAVEAGHEVVGLDVNVDRVARLAKGSSYVDDVSDETIRRALESGRYLPTADARNCRNFEVAVITVPTPLREGTPDLSFIERSGEAMSRCLSRGATVILESTTYPGTTVDLLVPVLERGSELRAGQDFFVGYSPERIDPGNRQWTLRTTPKIVSGIDPASLKAVSTFYETLVDQVVPVSSPSVAELAKILENTFRHVNIALMNELAMFATDLGVDVWEAIDAASSKPFGFMPFTPGPGVGGHCLPVDPSYLSWKVKRSLGFPFRFIELANDINDHMPDYVVRRVSALLNRDQKSINGSRILILGLTYKRNSADAREAPGPIICERFSSLGGVVHAIEPHLTERLFPACATRVNLTREQLESSDVVVIVTDHDAFDWDVVASYSKRIFDTRHRLPPADSVEFL